MTIPVHREGKKLSEEAMKWMALAESVASGSDPLERRLSHLEALTKIESYYGYFGRPIVANQ